MPVTKSAFTDFRRRHPPLLPAQPPRLPWHDRWLGGEEGRAAERAQKMRSSFWNRRKKCREAVRAKNPTYCPDILRIRSISQGSE